MDIFESLENLNISEECFDEIMGLVEEILSENYTNDYAKDVVKRGGKAAKSKAGTYSVEATNPDRDRPLSPTRQHIEADKAQGSFVPISLYKKAKQEEKAKEKASIYKSIDKNLQKNNPGVPAYNLRPSDEQHKQVENYLKKK